MYLDNNLIFGSSIAYIGKDKEAGKQPPEEQAPEAAEAQEAISQETEGKVEALSGTSDVGELDVTVKDTNLEIQSKVNADVEPIFDSVKFGSYNIIKITVKNNHNYYCDINNYNKEKADKLINQQLPAIS